MTHVSVARSGSDNDNDDDDAGSPALPGEAHKADVARVGLSLQHGYRYVRVPSSARP